MNKCVFLGRLVSEPVMRMTISNKKVYSFSIAVRKKYPRQGGSQVDYIDCTAWEVVGERIFEYFHQGDGIIVCGRIENDNYTKNDGTKVYRNVLIVEEWDFGPRKIGTSRNQNFANDRNYQNTAPTAPQGDGFMNIPDGLDEELPFS